MGSKTNSQQAPVHWLGEITKAKLSLAEPSQVLPSLGKSGQVWASLGKLRQIMTYVH